MSTESAITVCPFSGPFLAGFQQVHCQQEYSGDGNVHQHPAEGLCVIVGPPELIDGGGDGGGAAGV